MLIQKIKNIQTQVVSRVKLVPRKYLIGGALGVVLVVGVIAAYWPQKATFAYKQQTCIPQLAVAPGILRSNSDKFIINHKGGWSVGSVKVFATSACLQPTAVPEPGDYFASSRIFGVLPGRLIKVTVPEHPAVSTHSLGQPIPVSKPLEVSLSAADEVFEYSLSVGDKKTQCGAANALVRCPIETLDLDQGSEYRAKLVRLFDRQPVATIVDTSVQTLTAVAAVDTSIKPGAVVYEKPQQLTVAFDKPIMSATVRLERSEGDAVTKVATTHEATESQLEVRWEEELARSAEYRLVVEQVEAQDGSGLTDPYEIAFTTSGGPKVASVSVGTAGVAPGSTAVITFDQTLHADQPLDGIVATTGGAAVVGKKGNQLLVSLVDVPRCGSAVITLKDTLQSEYGVAGGSAWSYSLRMRCHSIETIGYSSKGRAISAYVFGGSGKTVVYTGAIHGNELSTRSLMLRWIDELEASAGSIPEGVRVVVIPTINPDGVAAGTRTNANNVDLNRNFGTSDWQKDITTVTNAPFPGGGGSAAMSEPETKALAGYVGRLRPQLVVSYHSIGGLLAANQAGNSSALAQVYAGFSGYRNTTGSSSTFEYAISGTADDYYAEQLGVPSILIELGSHSYHQFERNQKAMWAMLR